MTTMTRLSSFAMILLFFGFSLTAKAKVIEPTPTVTPPPTIPQDPCSKKPKRPAFLQVFQFPSSFSDPNFSELTMRPHNVSKVLGGAKNLDWKELDSNLWQLSYDYLGINIKDQLNVDSGKISGEDVYSCYKGRLTLKSVRVKGSIHKKSSTGRALSVGIISELLATVSGKVVSSNGFLWLTDEMKGKSSKKDFKIAQDYNFAGPQFPIAFTAQADKSIYALKHPRPRRATFKNPLARLYDLAIIYGKCEASDTLGWQCARYTRTQASVQDYRFVATAVPNDFAVVSRSISTARLKSFLDVPFFMTTNENTVDDETSLSDYFSGDAIKDGISFYLRRNSTWTKTDNSISHTVTYAEPPNEPAVVSVNCSSRADRGTCTDSSGIMTEEEITIHLDAAQRIESLLDGPGMGFEPDGP